MGTPWSEGTVIVSLVTFAKNFMTIRQSSMTFHIGDRRIWLPHDYNDYRIHNTNEVGRILLMLKKKKLSIMKHPVIKLYMQKLEHEVKGYTNMGETYSQDCWKLLR